MSLACMSQAVLRVQMLLFVTFAPSDKWLLWKAVLWVSASISQHFTSVCFNLGGWGKSVVREGGFVTGLTLQINIKQEI